MRKLTLTITLWLSAAIAMAQSFGNEWIDYSKTYYKFPVRENRLYRISKAVLTASGIGDIPAQDFQMWRNGEEVAIFTTESSGPLATNGYIEFIGKMNDGKLDEALYDDPANHVNKDYSYFSDTAWYYLTIAPGRSNLRITSALNTASSSTLRADSFFMHNYILRFGYQWNYGTGTFLPTLVRPDRVFGEVLRNSEFNGGEGPSSQGFSQLFPYTFSINNLQHYPGGPKMELAESVSGNYQMDRNILLYANDSLIKSTFSSYYDMKRDTVRNLPLSVIKSDGITFKYASDNGYYWESNLANLLTLKYPRKFNFQSARFWELKLPANASGNLLKIGAFRSDNMATILYDLTNHKRYVGVIKADSSFYGLEPSATERTIALANQSSFLFNVTSLTKKNFIDYAASANQGDYLIITNKVLIPTSGTDNIEAYRSYRSSTAGGSYNAKVYDIDELAEQFVNGLRKHPFAIRNFVRFANAKFANAPKFLFLIGKGTFYEAMRTVGNFAGKELLGAVPTFGTPPSDNLLVSANNINATPTIPIGRLSAISNAEVGLYLNKIKSYESLVHSGDAGSSERAWQKEILQLAGGDDSYLVGIISNYFRLYKLYAEDQWLTANVKNYSRINNPNFAADLVDIERRINSGTGIISYFGHSSASSIDFNLSSPEEYSNSNGRFPIFIANGCKAGNIFDFNGNRLLSKNQSISDNYIFADNKGAISFISNSDFGVLSYLHLTTRMFYTAFSKSHYGKSIGEIQQEAIRLAFAITGSTDVLNRRNLQQTVLHGDPAIVPFPYNKPDYTTNGNMVSLMPVSPSVATDSIWVKVKFGNIGKSVSESVDVVLQRELPDGTLKPLTTATLNNLYRTDSVMVKIGLKGLFETGTNYIVASIDPANLKQEMSEANNTARFGFHLNVNEIVPVFPYDLTIVNTPQVKLTASTVNPAAQLASYRLQVDTSRLFNSPAMFTTDVQSVGGAISFQPSVSWKNGTVYYWRVAPITGGQPVVWNGASFVYNTSLATGYNQSHYFQHQQSALADMELDSLSRRFEFGGKPHNLYIEHGIYASSGTEDSHFSIVVDGKRNIYSACLGQSIIFNLFDSLSFAQWDNSVGGRFGSGYYCGPGKEYNFEFKYFNHTNRKLIMDFIDAIPKGTFVAARLVLDAPYDSARAVYWKKDTLIYGAGKSLYHSLVNQGFKDLDSLNRPRTFAFVFKKDDSLSFKPFFRFSSGLYDRLSQSVPLNTKGPSGYVSSPLMGPSQQWKTLAWQWSPHPFTVTDPTTSLVLYGQKANGTMDSLMNIASDQLLVDISGISAAQYPYLQLRMKTAEPNHSKPSQLDFWRLSYEPVADGALSATDYWQWKADTLIAIKDSLKFGIAFKNVSNYLLPGTSYSLKLGNSKGQEITLKSGTIKSLVSGDTAILSMAGKTDSMYGRYYLRLEVNGNRNPVEQTFFNNLGYFPFYVDSLKNAYELLSFDAKPTNNIVTTNWSSAFEVKVEKYEVLYGTDSLAMAVIGTRTPGNLGLSQIGYTFDHTSPVLGNNFYRLKITDRYGNISYSNFVKIYVGLASFDAVAATRQVVASWKFLDEIKVAKYELEHQLNGSAWTVASTQTPLNNGFAELNYSVIHLKPGIGTNNYRLKITDAYGNVSYSAIKTITINLLNFDAVAQGKTVQTNWRFFNEINIKDYVLEYGTDSTKLKMLTTQSPTANGTGQIDYGYLHSNPSLGYNYYRLKVTDGNGNVAYSAIKQVFVGDATVVTVVPNPFSSLIRVVTSDNVTKWQLGLYDAAGKLVLSQTGAGTAELNTQNLPKGAYILKYQKGELVITQKMEKM